MIFQPGEPQISQEGQGIPHASFLNINHLALLPASHLAAKFLLSDTLRRVGVRLLHGQNPELPAQLTAELLSRRGTKALICYPSKCFESCFAGLVLLLG